MSREIVSILGAGSWGVALARLLANQKHSVRLWEIDPDAASSLDRIREIPDKLPGVRLPDNVEVSSDLTVTVRDSRFVLIVVPSRFFEGTLQKLTATGWPESSDCIVVIATKGLLHPGSRLLSREVEQAYHGTSVVVLSGPTHAEEVGCDMPTAIVSASKDPEAAQAVQKLVMSPRMRVYTNSDIVGVQIGASVKNVLAIASGIADGLGFGDNSRAALITRGVREMLAVSLRFGGCEETMLGLAGLGDLVVTCTSRHSRNRRLGEWIGKGTNAREALDKIGMVAEGYHTAQSVRTLEEEQDLDLPICREVYNILYEDKEPSQAVEELMTREPKREKVLREI